MTSPGTAPLVGIVMGSDSDWPVMEAAAKALDEFEIPYEVDVVSAHRMPHEMIAYPHRAAGRALKPIDAGEG
ncbi:AIR carboxylase family protein, partial [Streptomyces anulatus]|uniref:AIR carboxylase family protein n=1 Tax=Streptomyces anulatus TaxID=1892 RepID=UPI003663A244